MSVSHLFDGGAKYCFAVVKSVRLYGFYEVLFLLAFFCFYLMPSSNVF